MTKELDSWIAEQRAEDPDYHFGDYTRKVARRDPVKLVAAVMNMSEGPSPLVIRFVSSEIEAAQEDSTSRP